MSFWQCHQVTLGARRQSPAASAAQRIDSVAPDLRQHHVGRFDGGAAAGRQGRRWRCGGRCGVVVAAVLAAHVVGSVGSGVVGVYFVIRI